MLNVVSLLLVERCKQCKKRREDVNDDACSGCPRTSTIDGNIEAVRKMIMDNCRITIGEIAWLMPSRFYCCFRHEL